MQQQRVGIGRWKKTLENYSKLQQSNYASIFELISTERFKTDFFIQYYLH